MNIGIDFGTTNSSIAYQPSPREAPTCVPVDSHANLPFDVVLRSAVLLDQRGRVVKGGVGARALDPIEWVDPRTRAVRRALKDMKPFLSTFRLREHWPVMGTRIDDDAYDHLRQAPGESVFREEITVGELACSRDELLDASAAVFGRLFDRTPRNVMDRQPTVVVGMPLIFPDYAKKRLLEVIVRTGSMDADEPYSEALRRVRFLPEPVAASLLYALDCAPPRGRATGRVLVFDSGGGTLDLALLDFATIDGRYVPVKQVALRSAVLAGRRFDECIRNRCLEPHRAAIRRWNNESAISEPRTQWQMDQAAESIKLVLSTRTKHQELSLAGAGVRPEVTRAQFEEWVTPLLDETKALVRETVADLGSVDTVVMVGGSSLIPCVQQLMRALFPAANVVHEDAHQTGRGEGVERALTAVSRGLALYSESVASQGITPFAYGFWENVTGNTWNAVDKWTPHTAPRPVVRVPAPDGTRATTLTLVQDLTHPERVLNVINVPTHAERDGRRAVNVRVHTSDGGLYPEIELLDRDGVNTVDRFNFDALDEDVLADHIRSDAHVVRWSGSGVATTVDTPVPEIVTLRLGDPVTFWVRPDAGTRAECVGKLVRIDRISDGLPHAEVEHWDLRRWRFRIEREPGTVEPFVPVRIEDIALNRRTTPVGRRPR